MDPPDVPACPVCRAGTTECAGPVGWFTDTGLRAWLTTARCRRCEHGWLTAAIDTSSAYPSSYYTHSQPSGRRPFASRLGSLGVMSAFLTSLPPRARVLDVGCGNGTVLRHLRDSGFRPVGFDVDERAVAMAKHVSGTEVHFGRTLASCGLDQHSFDAVIANHVLEHVVDPRKQLASCVQAVRPGGHMLLAVPNSACLQARIFGGYWVPHEAPRHLQFFSPKSFRWLLRDSGLSSVVSTRPFQSPPAFGANVKRLWRYQDRRVRRLPRLTVGTLAYLAALASVPVPGRIGRRTQSRLGTNLVSFSSVTS